MSENSSSASKSSIMPAGKPASSFITESSKSGELGSNPIDVTAMDGAESTQKAKMTENFGSKPGVDFDGVKEVSPASKPSSSFINTGAVK